MKTDFSTVLSALRRDRGISQKQAASDLNISQALLSHYENGVREPKFEFVDKACTYYNVSADYILGRQSEDSVIVPCSSGYSGQIAATALNIVEFMKTLESREIERAMSDYLTFAAERVKRIIDSGGKPDEPELSALERMYMSAVLKAVRGESAEELNNAINELKALI